MPTVRPIDLGSRKDLLRFLRLPLSVHAPTSPYVAPLISERLRFFNPLLNPFFDHAEIQLFLAEEPSGRVVGRIAAIHNKLHSTFHGRALGFFGFFEAFDDLDAAQLLFHAAEVWLREKGLHAIQGPVSPSINHECGCLVHGFDRRPKLLLSYNHSALPRLIEACGYQGVQDMVAYEVAVDGSLPPRLMHAAKILAKRHNFSTRPFDFKKLDSEIDLIYRIYNEAWSQNFGFVPLTREEIAWLAKELRPLVRPDLCRLAEVNGEPAGVMIALPDVNQALWAVRGRLLPLGWLKLAKGMRRIDALHGLVMGIRPRFRRLGIDHAFYLEGLRGAQARGMKSVELSWVLAHNVGILRALERIGARETKRYRLYEKQL